MPRHLLETLISQVTHRLGPPASPVTGRWLWAAGLAVVPQLRPLSHGSSLCDPPHCPVAAHPGHQLRLNGGPRPVPRGVPGDWEIEGVVSMQLRPWVWQGLGYALRGHWCHHPRPSRPLGTVLGGQEAPILPRPACARGSAVCPQVGTVRPGSPPTSWLTSHQTHAGRGGVRPRTQGGQWGRGWSPSPCLGPRLHAPRTGAQVVGLPRALLVAGLAPRGSVPGGLGSLMTSWLTCFVTLSKRHGTFAV